jgi:aspartyl-tRNA(Asn)/glutamyl-tRNA(Gln) amidotransferase subunit C
VSIDRAKVRHVAHLARLQLGPDEEEKFAAQLSNVLGYIEKLAQVDVSQVEPLAFAGDAAGQDPAALLRPDVAMPGLSRDEALAAAPKRDEQAFLVPRILE